MRSHFTAFAHYNAWANHRLYEAASHLPDAQYRQDLGAFFRSVHGTLNHLLVTDRVWMHRITGTGEAPKRLDTILFDALPDLRIARQAEDRRIIDYLVNTTEDELAGTISYRRVSTPEPFVQKLTDVLAHLFNHQTHHRGQAHALLTRLTGAAPELDLLFFQRETAAK